jgi:hypothetical protein
VSGVGQSAENDAPRDEVAKWLAVNDPDPCDPIEYDAATYYRDFADALLGSGWRVIPPGTTS